MAWSDDLRVEIQEMFLDLERVPGDARAAWGLGISLRQPPYQHTGPRTVLKFSGPDGKPVMIRPPEERAERDRQTRNARARRRRMHLRSEQVNAMGRAHALFPSLSQAAIRLIVVGALRGNPAGERVVLETSDPEDLRRCREWAATIQWSPQALQERKIRQRAWTRGKVL